MSETTPTPWAIRPNRFDDWGYIRGADGETACIARGHSDKSFDEHRKDKTDPYEPNARLIVEAVNNHEALKEQVAWWEEQGRQHVTRIHEMESELASCRECRSKIDCLSRGAVPVRDDGAERIRELEAALEDALQAANLLLQNSIACVEMHHGLDVQANGLPGWLNDTKAKIERSAALQPKDTAK